MSATPLRPGERVYSALKERLLNGAYDGGQRLNADEIANDLDASRQPVFDAFKRLSTEGFLDVRPHVGCHVATYALTEVRDYFQLFAAVEGSAAALAAARREDGDLPPLRRLHAQIGGLTGLSDAVERARGYRELNREFHSKIHAMAGSAIVESIGSGMYDRADFFINGASMKSPFSDSVEERHDGHAAIVTALEAGDEKAARAAASDHILATVTLIEAAIAESGERSAA